MSKGLETLREIGEEVIKVTCLAGWVEETVKEAYGKRFDGIEEELKDYHEIKEIAGHYHFDDLARDTHMTTTDEKYLRLFNAAIPSIQADYRKARAFDIIKEKGVDLGSLLYYAKNSNHALDSYNRGIANKEKELTKDEFFYILNEAMRGRRF